MSNDLREAALKAALQGNVTGDPLAVAAEYLTFLSAGEVNDGLRRRALAAAIAEAGRPVIDETLAVDDPPSAAVIVRRAGAVLKFLTGED